MIFQSSYPRVSIAETALTPFVFRHAERLADKPAFIDGSTGRALSYTELYDSVRRCAAGLVARGLCKGDVFAICSPNLPEYAIAFHGVALAGGVVTTLNPIYTAEEIAHQLNDSNAKYLLTVPQLFEKAATAAAHTNVRAIFVVGEAPGATSFADLLGCTDAPPKVEINFSEDVVALPYSSGTTGLPKGVMLTHQNLVANLCQMESCEVFLEDDTTICVLPMFHIFGMSIIMNLGLFMGATIVTLPRFELENFLETLERYGVTQACLVPPIVLSLAKNSSIEKYDLSKLKRIFVGAAPLAEDIARRCAERLNCVVYQGYGMTETSPGAILGSSDPARIKHGSVGFIVPNTEVKIIDIETGAPRNVNEEGELCVRGLQVMKGYLNRPAETAQTVDADGWLHTGDIARIDADGHVFIVDRLKELIKYKGFQVAPAELEAILLSHPAVADAAVIPLPDDECGEIPKAFIVLKSECASDEIMQFVAARVAPYKKIRCVEIVSQIPKSPSGKILRRILKKQGEVRKTEGKTDI